MSINTDRDHDSDNSAAARLLEMTARETDQWRADAKSEAAAIVAEARTEAERLLAAAREDAERTANGARVEAYRARQEVARLEETATEYREQLKRHLTELLDQVDSATVGGGAG